MQPGKPPKSATQNQPGRARVRDYAGGKNQSVFLRSEINRTK